MTTIDEGTAKSDLDLLQRVVLPQDHDPDVLSLYVDADYWSSIPITTPKDRIKRGPVQTVLEDPDRAVIRLSDMSVLSGILPDNGFVVPHRRRVSFGTYFNAFPASYWRTFTTLEAVVLRVRTAGTGKVIVSRSNARSVIQRVEQVDVSGETVSEFVLPFTNFTDGGWYWFDLLAETSEFSLVEAGWYAPADVAPTTGGTGSLSIAITTLNRAEYCLEVLRDIGMNAEISGLIDRLYVTDQGTQKVADQDGIDEVRALLGDKLQINDQVNIGGSGGFSRGMYETVEAGLSDYVLLLDDDIKIEPESIRRVLKFADYSRTSTIVGGHMFDMYDKSKLHAFAEGMDMGNFNWGPLTPGRHDFAASNLRQTDWLHRRIDGLYNGWWMCLIPVSVIKQIGLSLPVFIKWDDAEYALRAREVGVPTVTLPGAAVWHVSWVDKDDATDWQAFFHARNRLIAALLHSPFPKGGRLLTANLATDIRHLVSMQYAALALRHEAYRNILRGPDGLHEDMHTRLARSRALMGKFSDGTVIKDREALPPISTRLGGPAPTNRSKGPGRYLRPLWLARVALRHGLSSVPPLAKTEAQAHLTFEDARWWVTPMYDSVLVSNAEGSGATFHTRDPKLFRTMLLRSLRLRMRLIREWPQLREQYRSALPRITSVESWKPSFRSK
jgi:galactofuranosylgalactofuranosylrhamnosyl-N-acetylglucosaminyl-diphospho-decaprenol beta-1,5/1,6-galactofuranosyltransferase